MQYIMIVIILFVGIVGLLLSWSSRDNDKDEVVENQKDYERLFCSNNKNSYTTARRVYEVLADAGIEACFLEDPNE